MTPSAFSLSQLKSGKRLGMTDGTTLLGADDKAGVAEIMTLAEHLLRPDAPGFWKIRIGLRRTRKSGEGTKFFDLENLVPRLLILLTAEPWVNWNMKTFNADCGNYHHQEA